MNKESVTEESRMGSAMVDGELKTFRKGYTSAEYTPWIKSPLVNNLRVDGEYLTEVLNDEKVREALHIPTFVPGWEMCNMDIHGYY